MAVASLSKEQITAFHEAGLRLIDETRRLIHQKLAAGFTAERKPDNSFVTEVDLEVEQLVRDWVSAQFPDHGVLGEEYGTLRPESPFRWIIDPIDGTLSLRSGIPLYGTILALLFEDEPVVGIINLPGLGRTYHAARGIGAFRGKDRLNIPDLKDDGDLPDEVISISDRKQFITAGRTEVFDTLMQRHARMRTYTDCFGHALAAEGAIGAAVDFDLSLWDAAATQVLIEEAGGVYVTIPPAAGRDGKYNLVFGKPRVVQWVLEQMGESEMRRMP